MSVADAGRKRWEGVSQKERKENGRRGAEIREERRRVNEARVQELRTAATLVLKAMEGGSLDDCLAAMPRLKEALAT